MARQIPPSLASLYRQLVRCFPIDITYVLVRRADCKAKPLGLKQLSTILYRVLDSTALKEVAHDKRFKVTSETLKSMRRDSIFAIGAFVDSKLVALLFIATGTVNPKHNRGGDRFRGIGLKLPEKTCYLFKATVLPEFRGQKINQMMTYFALEHCAEKNINTMVTTTDIGNLAYLTSISRCGFKTVGYAGEWLLFGKSFFKLPKPTPVLSDSRVESDETIELFYE